MKLYTLKSKTHITTTIIATLGSLMTFLPTVRDMISPEWYGPSFVIIGLIFHTLRNVTTTPIEYK